MKLIPEKRPTIINVAIILLIVASIFLNITTLKDGHNWGADFAQYIIHAKNVLAHKPFTDGVMLDNPFSYPPGFPWLIAPVIKIFGVNFIILKFLNIIFWYLSLLFPSISITSLSYSKTSKEKVKCNAPH